MALFHYTSIDALISILSSDRNHPDMINLRAYSYIGTNDQDDCQYLIDQLMALKRTESGDSFNVNEYREQIIQQGFFHLGIPHYVSFTQQENSAYMWHFYSRGNEGAAIELISNPIFTFDDPLHRTFPPRLLPCYYWDRDEITSRYFERYCRTENLNETNLVYDACMVKNPSFIAEQEYRAICFAERSIMKNDSISNRTYVNFYTCANNVLKIHLSPFNKSNTEHIALLQDRFPFVQVVEDNMTDAE